MTTCGLCGRSNCPSIPWLRSLPPAKCPEPNRLLMRQEALSRLIDREVEAMRAEAKAAQQAASDAEDE